MSRARAGLRWRTVAEAALVLAVIPLAAHLTLSPIGFNPTDDGFVLAGARRILAGQVPHRDFVSIRPVGSFYLHAPEAALGGTRVLLLSRAVFWLEMAIGAWCWILLLEAVRRKPFVPGARGALAATVFALNAHTFPPMAWHSVDAATLAAVGLAIAARGSGASRLAGYALLGLAPVCRQNFLPMVPLAVLLLGDARRPWCWLAALAPAGIYAANVAAAGGWGDMAVQLGARTGLAEPGFLAFARLPLTWIGLGLGVVAAVLAARHRSRGIGAALAAVVAVAGAMALWHGSIHAGPGFMLWGVAAGIALARGLQPAGEWLVVAAGWCVGVSLGYNTPALLAGALAAVPAALAVGAVEDGRPRAAAAGAIVLAIFSLASLRHARLLHVYRDLPAAAQSADLGAVLPGGTGVRTGPGTARFMADLGEAVARCHGRPYAVVPDCAAWWIRVPGINPLPADWLSNTEISNPPIFLRVLRALDEGRGRRYILLQKVRADSLAGDRRPMRDQADYAIAEYVRKAFRKSGETAFFEVYF